jgi:hypothetical protein
MILLPHLAVPLKYPAPDRSATRVIDGVDLVAEGLERKRRLTPAEIYIKTVLASLKRAAKHATGIDCSVGMR